MEECLEVNGRQLFVRVDCNLRENMRCWCNVISYNTFCQWQTV